MDNPGFLPEEDETPSTGDQNRKDLDPKEDEIKQTGSQMMHSQNTQEITAIIHPEPPEILKESENTDSVKSEESSSKNGDHNGSIHNSKQSKSEAAPPINKDDSLTMEHVSQTSDEKPVRSNSLTNGCYVPIDTIHKAPINNESTVPENPAQEVQLNGTHEKQGEKFHSSDSSISIPEAETLASNKKSGWYYALLAIFFLGFFLALTLGLIFGKGNKD